MPLVQGVGWEDRLCSIYEHLVSTDIVQLKQVAAQHSLQYKGTSADLLNFHFVSCGIQAYSECVFLCTPVP